MASTVILEKITVDGKRPGDEFTRQGDTYRVVQVRRHGADRVEIGGAVVRVRQVTAYVTDSRYGREVWF